MKLESLNSKKFKSLKQEELNKINGGNNEQISDFQSSGVSVTWTKSSQAVDDSCSDCDCNEQEC